MARKVKPRDSYAQDLTSLSRLCEALEKDVRRDPDWRANATGLIRLLQRTLERPVNRANETASEKRSQSQQT